jgi:hypothetical protein
MPYTDEKRYPGLFRLRGGLRSRPKTEMPRPEARVTNRKVVPQMPPFATKAGPSMGDVPQTLKMLKSFKTGETSPNAKARETLGWGGQKFAGKMTTDQFVSLAGALGHAIAPNTPQGRVGSVMSQFGQQEMLRRRGMAEALRKEGIEREKLHTKTLIDVGAEERKRESDIATAKTLAGTKATAAKTLAGAKVTAAGTLAGTKAGAEKIKATAKKLEGKESIRQFNVKEARLGKETGKGKKGITPAEKWKQTKDIKAAEMNILDPEFLEDPRIQTEIDFVNEYGDKPYIYQRTEGTPGKETGYFDLERDVEAIPSTIEKVDVSTPEKIRDSHLSRKMKMKLLKTRFGFK